MGKQIVIIGAGLSGLRIASLLTKQQIPCTVLEARGRIGGRVMSGSLTDRPELGTFDLGASWFWPEHGNIITNLIAELGLETFDQYTEGEILLDRFQESRPVRYTMPDHAQPRSLRIAGGMESFIRALADTIPPDVIRLQRRVKTIRMNGDGDVTVEAIRADGEKEIVHGSTVIFALPPRMIARNMSFFPALPEQLIENLMNKPTWMAGQAKAIAIYDRPFWRDKGLSGFVSSSVGPLQEIHDASPKSGSGALFGFFGLSANERRSLGSTTISDMVIDQLGRLFGPSAKHVQGFLYKDWSEDIETFVPEDGEPMRHFSAYGPTNIEGVWENKIFFGGTEMSPHVGGHLEGALQAADQIVRNVIDNLN